MINIEVIEDEKEEDKTISNLIIENSVKEIKAFKYSFYKNLKTVFIPKSVEKIGTFDNAMIVPAFSFQGCKKLESFNVDPNNNNYCSIDGMLFNKNKTSLLIVPPKSFGEVNVPFFVEEIESGAFLDCSNITSIKFERNVKRIGKSAFLNCKSLTAFEVSKENPNFVSISGVLYNKDERTIIKVPSVSKDVFIIKEEVEKIGDEAFLGCSEVKTIFIPYSLTKIGNEAFDNCDNLEKIEVNSDNKNFISIEGCLYNKEKTILIRVPEKKSGSFIIPKTVVEIANHAFDGCKNITDVYFPSSVKRIGDEAFFDCCELECINMEDPYKIEFGNDVFFGCDNLKVPNV